MSNLPKPPPKLPPRPGAKAPGSTPAGVPGALPPRPGATPSTMTAPAPRPLPQAPGAPRAPLAPAAAPAAQPAAPMASRPGLPAAPGSAPRGLPARPGAPAAAPGAVSRTVPVAGTPVQQIRRVLPADLAGLPLTVANMAEAIRLFDGVLIEENRLLAAQDVRGVAALQERKFAATRLYQERIRALIRDRTVVTELEPEQRDKLLRETRTMEQRCQENAALLRAGMNALDKLFEAVNHAAKRQKVKEVAYGKAGVMSEPHTPHGAAVAFNRTA